MLLQTNEDVTGEKQLTRHKRMAETRLPSPTKYGTGRWKVDTKKNVTDFKNSLKGNLNRQFHFFRIFSAYFILLLFLLIGQPYLIYLMYSIIFQRSNCSSLSHSKSRCGV
jgi:hypothetical protein